MTTQTKAPSATQAGHTLGPWHVGAGNAARIVYDERGLAIADAKLFHGNRRDGEDYANARLIAAAPELLAACELALAHCDTSDGLRNRIADTLRAAIAAATRTA